MSAEHKQIESNNGCVHYWISRNCNPNAKCILFTHGLTANHTMFEKQVEYFTTGKVKQYNKAWAKATGYPLHIIKYAAHFSNGDNPEQVNLEIENFIQGKGLYDI